MNDSEFEDQLRALSPVAPSPHLAERIGRQLAAPRSTTPAAGVIERPVKKRGALDRLWSLGWAGAGVAIVLAIVTIVALAPEHKSTPATADTTSAASSTATVAATPPPESKAASEDQAFEPTQSSRELIAVDNSNEVLETAEGPVREVRYTYLERLAWAHPTTGARLEIEVPREDVYLMPVSLQ